MYMSLEKSVKNLGECFSRIIFPLYALMDAELNYKQKEYKCREAMTNVDHWATIVPLCLLEKFYLSTPEWLIENRYCDVRFCVYTETYNSEKITKTVTQLDSIPLYYYRIHENSICNTSKREIHEHINKLKSKIGKKILGKIAHLMCKTKEEVLNILCRNMEISTIRYYPKRPPIQEYYGYKLSNEERGNNRLLSESLLKIYPSIEEWSNEVYGISS